MYSIEYSREARKALLKMPRNLQKLLVSKVEELARDPFASNNNVRRLVGRPECRLRVQDWRVIYRVLDDRVVLLVINDRLERRGVRMSKVQIIEKDGKPAFAVVPIELWERIREAGEDAEDAADIEQFDREDDGFRIPHEVVVAEMSGQHPIRAWREYRRLTQERLAAAAGISIPFLSQIEGGKRVGTLETLCQLARALEVPVDALVGNDVAPDSASRA